ncbi:DNA repair protein RecN [Aquimarina sp. W85]|uniref:DNA repair protein RecN n=1 Tax=Aquimarina rhodophyticola TaxID=3342246 RepID=UPI0036713F31
MLQSLSIQNYALIDQLQVSFDAGYIIITGETGAGKSLLLGALGLLLGKRADLTSIKDNTSKCIIEGVFSIAEYDLENVFKEEDLDYENETIIRREILPSGKSRAFINDTPVTLSALHAVGVHLIDIHSQHQTLEVTSNDFQFEVLDALAGTSREIDSFKRGLQLLKAKEKEVNALIANQDELTKAYEYNSFLFKELDDAKLKIDELPELEADYETLNNIEDIQDRLSSSINIIGAEELGVSDQIRSVKLNLQKIESYTSTYKDLSGRVESIAIEIEDILASLENELDRLEADPSRLLAVSQRLQLIHDLQTKHSVTSVQELVEVRDTLDEQVAKTDSLNDDIKKLQSEIVDIQKQLDQVAAKIHSKRTEALPKLVKELELILKSLGMDNATFKAEVILGDTYYNNGKDELNFLFSANKGGTYGLLKKVASGGELSRIMLSIKVILSRYSKLPTIIFDEIDTGVSGEVAHKMADLMKTMSKNLQVISITHLPQIAAKGEQHYKVFKEDLDASTVTRLKLLSPNERVNEIAEMIGGKDISESALTHARSLLNIV